ncbi:LysR substrate-binding domain-containing protein [Pseudomonas simiae]|uniref:LysR substrate-binding domain-containing protein n=1 Tax=Pseudomonas simiae TaxID=321846 RepID=UPI000944E8C7|nr:LysR substrate-binding domain-containing protein [Pseudomonas simiae]
MIQGANTDRLRLGLDFLPTTHLTQAVSPGIGVGLVPSFLVRDELANGTLRTPFESILPTGTACLLVIPPHKAAYRPMAVFRDWLIGFVRFLT